MIVFITGASSGFGAAIARRFAKESHQIIAVGRRQDRLDALAKEIGRERVLTLVLDVPPGEVRELEPSEVAALERAGRPRKKAPEPPRALRKVEERHLPLARPARKRTAKPGSRKRASRSR